MRKAKTTSLVLAAFVAVSSLTGCAPTFSRGALDQVDRGLAFSELQKNPELFEGKWVLLGGIILDIRNAQEGSTIEVLHRPVDRQARPRETDESEGRFLVESNEYLDPAVYSPGKRISLIGTVSGREMRPLGQMHYRYPVVTVREIRLWEQRRAPQFSFGIGIGVHNRF